MTDKEIMQMALDALEKHVLEYETTEALRARLAQPEPGPVATLFGSLPVYDVPQAEPVAWRTFDGEGGYEYRSYEMNENYAEEWNKRNPNHKGWVEPLYTAPPQREWQGLTDEEIALFAWEHAVVDEEAVRAIEAKLKEKNNA